METKGKFIVFEGIDGSGKTTQMKQLNRYLREKGIPTHLTAEPTESPFGAQLRTCLTGRVETNEYTIAALFAADRLDHLYNSVNGILKKIYEGVTVLCDRYYFSSLVYNGSFVPREWVKELNRPAIEALQPDLVVFIDITGESAMERVSRRGETERYESLEKLKNFRNLYMNVFREFPAQKLAVIESDEDKTKTQYKVREAVDGLFGF